MIAERLMLVWDRVRRGTIDTLERFEDDEWNWRPWPGGRTVLEIALHIAHEEQIEIAHGLARRIEAFPEPFPADRFPDKDSLLRVLAEVHLPSLEFLGALDDRALFDPAPLAWGETAAPFEVVLHVVEHEIHHRGELSLALGILGRQGYDA